jgi:two-component system sensor histidine kinase KdpD
LQSIRNVPIIAFNLGAVLTGAMAGRLKDSAKQARAAESEIAIFLSPSEKLQEAISLPDAMRIARTILPFRQLVDLEIFILDDGKFSASDAGNMPPDITKALMFDARSNGPSRKFQAFPLMGSEGEIGLANFELGNSEPDDLVADLQGIANILALAIDRCLLMGRLAINQALQKSPARSGPERAGLGAEPPRGDRHDRLTTVGAL